LVKLYPIFFLATEWKHWLFTFSLVCLEGRATKKVFDLWKKLVAIGVVITDVPFKLSCAKELTTMLWEFYKEVEIVFGVLWCNSMLHKLIHVTLKIVNAGT
jgi:hypothetical protein